jgi:hypothetical protein
MRKRKGEGSGRSRASVRTCLLLTVASGAIVSAQTLSAPPAKFQLTVDSIMRGPALVGYPPSDLRWSGDSKELYFEWRMNARARRSTSLRD